MVSEVRTYRDLKVWQEAMRVAEKCCVLTGEFPKEELYGMTSQVRRAAASLAANIAEGHGRDSRGDFIRGLRVAQGSLKELETHLILAQRIGMVSPKSVTAILGPCESLGKMLRALIRSLRSSTGGRPRN
jgi:four helix bundle protein